MSAKGRKRDTRAKGRRWSRAGLSRQLLRVVRRRYDRRPVPMRVIHAVRAVGTGSSPLAPVSKPAPASRIAAKPLGALLEGVELGTWALGPKSIDALVTLVGRLKPALVLEFGSGSSTVVLAWAIRHACGPAADGIPRIVSVEQDEAQAERTRRLLRDAGLEGEATIVVAPLAEQEIEGGTHTCYGLPADFAEAFHGRRADLVVVDGPAGPPGVRFGTLPLARPYTRPGATFVLDDALRDGELDIARRWARLPYVEVRGLRLIEKGILVGRVLAGPPRKPAGRMTGLVRRLLLRPAATPAGLGLRRIGSGYGGWIVPTGLVTPDWIVYCGGVGEDITFDLGLIRRFGCRVHAFDPTPRAIAHVAAHAEGNAAFSFRPVGLWDEDTTLRFFAPQDPEHVSHSVVNLQGTDAFFEAPVRSLPSLMAELGHDRIDLLKIDIEGAEHRVTASVLAAGIRPRVLCMEIDQPVRARALASTVLRVRRAGYALVAVDGWNLTFMRRDVIAAAPETAPPAPVAVEAGTPLPPGTALPRISFGVIVLNGEPFTVHTLRSLYPYAHQVIVAEGAAPGARNIATPDGHSRDGTLEVLRRFQAEEDPDGKVIVVTAEDEGHPDGFWPGEKDEQSRAYASRATGDYLWQVDIDEFYRPEDMEAVLGLLADDPTIDAMTFHQVTFWGGLDYVVDGWYLRRGAAAYHRLFRWGPGFEYVTHRPPTVRDAAGRDLRRGNWLDARTTSAAGITLQHYSLLLPSQVIEKCDYYATADWARRTGAVEWAEDAWLHLRRPFRVHNVFAYPSWLERYRGDHPPEIVRMMDELRAMPDAATRVRRTDDIEALLDSRWYRVRRTAVRAWDPWDLRLRRLVHPVKRLAGTPRRAASAASRRS